MIKVKRISKTFGDLRAIEDVSFEIGKGEFVYLTGPSGAGKTTLIKLILRDYLPDEGDILLDGKSIIELPDSQIPILRQNIGVVFQDFKLIPDRTISENVSVALAVSGVPPGEWKKRVRQVMKLVGLDGKQRFFPAQLSGGELQRVAMARALVINPKILIADEPTGNLDWEIAEQIIDLFEKINKEGKTILVATHHQGLVKGHKKRVVKIDKGRMVDAGKKKVKTKKAKIKAKTETKEVK